MDAPARSQSPTFRAHAVRLIGVLLLLLALGGWRALAEPTAGTPPMPLPTSAALPPAEAAARIDALLTDALARRGHQPAPVVDDATFARRVFLDLIGRIPSYDELTGFLDDPAPDKRSALIDRLLASDGYVHGWYPFWADLLRVRSRLMRNMPGGPYIAWLKQALRENVHYDELVGELLLADGSPWEDGNGAVGFWLRDAGMNEDHMANTARVFLGTRLACAQCHDHPFDRWTRHDFLAMAAYTHSVRAGPGLGWEPQVARRFRELVRAQRDQRLRQTARQFARTVGVGVRSFDRRRKRLPKDYQYDDGEANQLIQPAVIFGEAPDGPGGARADFARWLTNPENPRFTTVIVNRLWQRLMGAGLFEPVDDLRDDSPIRERELLAELETIMRENDYDLRAFLRIVCNTQAYQRPAPDDDALAGLAGPALRRLTAEQIWDSVLTLIDDGLDNHRGPAEQDFTAQYQQLADAEPQELLAVIGQLSDVRQQARALQQELQRARRDKNWQRARELARQRRELQARVSGMTPTAMQRRWRSRQGKELVRAAELPSPAPPDHPLRQFGQSDRDQIDGGHRQPSVLQALFLLNGLVDQHVLDEQSALVAQLRAAGDDDERLRRAWLCVLSRQPRPDELRAARPIVAEHGAGGYADLIWALLNQHEFLFTP